MLTKDNVVYGERVKDLLPGLLKFRDAATFDDDGMWTSSITLDPTEGAPVQRALMRVEAELLREDADAIGSGEEEHRTYEQRAADALLRLVQAIGGGVARPGEAAAQQSASQWR
jgi:Domain of unknown function (DUF222)